MIAKLTNGIIYPCPLHGCDGTGTYHTNLRRFYERHISEAAQDEYYPVKYTEKPIGNYAPSWELRTLDDVLTIVQIWTEYTPGPEPMEVDIEKLRSDVDYIAMMTDIDLDGGML